MSSKTSSTRIEIQSYNINKHKHIEWKARSAALPEKQLTTLNTVLKDKVEPIQSKGIKLINNK